MWVLFSTSLLSAVLLAPFYEWGGAHDFLMMIPKALLVTASWISGLIGMKILPLTTSSTIKASRPVFVVITSILIFGERLNWGQIAGILISLAALWLLSRSSRKEGIYFSRDRGVWWMIVSVATGVASALYDKHIMKGLSPDFVQSWSTLFIAVLMGLVLAGETIFEKRKATAIPAAGSKTQEGAGSVNHSTCGFRWDWNLVVVSVSILLADMAYFHALKDPDALLSIVSLMRRGCAIVSFILSVIIFKERNIRSKALCLGLLMVGMAVMALAS